MNVAIMQPYFFPYLGYFQLIRAVDIFVVYDDVNYIKGGWINRNNILVQNRSQLLTLALEGASSNKRINEISLAHSIPKILKTVRQNYGSAPYFDTVFPLVENILMQPETNLARFLEYGLRQICNYIGIKPVWYVSSALNKNNLLRGQDKVLAICTELGATQYTNMPGGKALYDKEAFSCQNIQLSFIQPRAISYRQFSGKFVPNLSIIDVLMFNDKEQCAKMLEEHDLV